MKKSFKTTLIKGLIIFGAGFFVLFMFRFIYGFQAQTTSATIANNAIEFNYRISNIASSKMMIKGTGEVQQYNVDQKYQKIATINTTTGHFQEEEQKVRGLVRNFNALIQYEQNTGLPGNRMLHLAIGVPPNQFDAMITELKTIGELKALQINKTDKTNEFKELNGERSSLEKTRDALVALKAKGGKIDEFINLENRILEIEEKLQKLGVHLGEYDATNEFCTVKLTLTEMTSALKISLFHRVKVALEWTIKYYLLFTVILLVASLTTLVILVIVDKLKALLGIDKSTGLVK